MVGYVKLRHPHRIGETILAVIVKRIDNNTLRCLVITPKSDLDFLEIKKEDILSEKQF